MKDNIEFIVFAVKQANEAEEYGFTRNECSRNLRLSIDHYWQHKTLGAHIHGQRKKIPRSKQATNKVLGECTVAHVVPMMVIINMLMDMNIVTKNDVENVLRKYFRVLVITKEEHQRLASSGLRSKMPDDWDGENVWARHEKVGIERSPN